MLGVQPSGQPITGFAGALYGFGWWTGDYHLGVPSPIIGTENVVSNTANVPAYYLIEPNGSQTPYTNIAQLYFTSPTQTTACLNGTSSTTGYWSLTWSNASVTTPGYIGAALKATYTEGPDTTHCSQPNPNYSCYIENWYYATGIGVVEIQDLQGGYTVYSPPKTLALVRYDPGNGGGPYVGLKDEIIAKAGTPGNLYFSQWDTFFTAATNLIAPTATQACYTGTTVLTIDQYLALLENIGTPCSTVQYPGNINTTLQQMESRAGTSTGLDWDQWNYYYQQVTGSAGPGPGSVCMKQVSSTNAGLVYPNEWMLFTGRQWLLYFEHTQGWPACAS
jgi:hypothetical protein